MFISVVVVAFTNLVVGYALAVALRADVWARCRQFRLTKVAKPGEEISPAEADEPSDDGSATPDAPSFHAAMPPSWLAKLAQHGIEANSLVEASAQVMRLEVGRYRKELITLENQTRSAAPGETLATALQQISARLNQINTAWMQAQREAFKSLQVSKEKLGDLQAMGEALEGVFHDQAAQIETTTESISQVNFAQEAELGRQRLAGEFGRLLDLAHRLRDQMQEVIATVLAVENRLEGVDAALQVDPATGCLSRLGLEVLYHDWQQHKDDRQLCLGVVDADRFGRITTTFGAAAGDEVLRELATVLQASIRADRGFDRVCRIGGTTFLMFYGFTGPRNANSSLERLRQSVEATTFQLGDKSFDLTVSGGAVEAQAGEKLPALLQRAMKALSEAKRKGRNRVALDEGAGPTVAEAPQFQVQGRTIEVEPVAAT